jgi:hypothetical protein
MESLREDEKKPNRKKSAYMDLKQMNFATASKRRPSKVTSVYPKVSGLAAWSENCK